MNQGIRATWWAVGIHFARRLLPVYIGLPENAMECIACVDTGRQRRLIATAEVWKPMQDLTIVLEVDRRTVSKSIWQRRGRTMRCDVCVSSSNHEITTSVENVDDEGDGHRRQSVFAGRG